MTDIVTNLRAHKSSAYACQDCYGNTMADSRSVAQIIADPQTPTWIKEAVQRFRKTNPSHAALLEAIHDIRSGASK